MREFFVQLRGADRAAELEVVSADRVGDVGLEPEIRQLPVLRHASGQVRKRIRTGRVRQVILADEGVGREQRRSTR